MALNATVIKVRLQIADMDRGYYQDHALTLAQHPSETDERLMVRLLAFILNASETLAFSKGLSSEDDEPELLEKNLHGDIEHWFAFGTPDEKWLRKASHKAKRVTLYAYGGRALPIWWQQNEGALQRYPNLAVWSLEESEVSALGAMASRSLRLQCNISEGQVWLSNDADSVTVEPACLKAAD